MDREPREEFEEIKRRLVGKETSSTYKGMTTHTYTCEGWIDHYYDNGELIGRFKGKVCFDYMEGGLVSESHYLTCKGFCSPDQGGQSYSNLDYFIKRYHLTEKKKGSTENGRKEEFGEQLRLFY